MKRFLDILAKLGIFRSGSFKGTYKNAKEMPDELMFEGVYNAKKRSYHQRRFEEGFFFC
ncbi:MAG: hypothetical protein KC736_03745 [Candidatus Moranbacteria bacterium]|nr:hypothetical protein [Candidatus Moranbacteria bacterium]